MSSVNLVLKGRKVYLAESKISLLRLHYTYTVERLNCQKIHLRLIKTPSRSTYRIQLLSVTFLLIFVFYSFLSILFSNCINNPIVMIHNLIDYNFIAEANQFSVRLLSYIQGNYIGYIKY